MPGFIVHIGNDKLAFAPEKRNKLIVNHIDGDCFQAERRVVNKFMNDRLFFENDCFFVIVEGVILNNHKLITEYGASSWADCVQKMYLSDGDSFFNSFRGSFSGILYDKNQDKWLIYTNHIGDKQVFVYKTFDGYIFASEIGFIADCCKINKLPLTIDQTGCYMSLTFGFCIEDRTLISEVKKLAAGHYYKLQNNKLEEFQYHRFSNKPCQMTIQDAVEGIDKYFRQAIQRAFEKDKEYGYRHIACLSGGLDSRMTVWVAHQMGYTDQLNLTYSESGYLDFSIAQQIAIDLHHDWVFSPLDGGDCIPRFQFLSELTYGSGFMLGHGYQLEKLINYEDYGIIHTGQIGDAVIGTFYKKLGYVPLPKISDGAYSQELLERMMNYQLKYSYSDSEIFKFYGRAFCGANQGLLTFQENSESYSPFTDVDMMQFALSMPLELRLNHKIYFDWILDKYPEAGEYVWESTRKKIYRIENHQQRTMNILGFEVPHFTECKALSRYLKGFILRRLGIRKKKQKMETIVLKSKSNMNPVDYWYDTNPEIKKFMDALWLNYKSLIPDNLKEDMRHLYEDCVVYDKLQCLSVLSAIKLIKQ